MSSISNVTIKALHVRDVVSFNCADLTINQAFTPTWSAEQAYGKMDPISTYSHTGRTAQFNMVLLSTTAGQARNLQDKVDRFVKFQYPKYTNRAGSPVLASPPFFEITSLHEKLYSTMKGYFTAFTIIPGSGEDLVPLISSDGMIFERKYTIDFTMTVLHSYLPGWIDELAPGQGRGGFMFRNSDTVADVEAANAADAAAAANAAQVDEALTPPGPFGMEGMPPLTEEQRDLMASMAQFAPGSTPINTEDLQQTMNVDPDTPIADVVANQGDNHAVSVDTANDPGPVSTEERAKANAQAAEDAMFNAGSAANANNSGWAAAWKSGDS